MLCLRSIVFLSIILLTGNNVNGQKKRSETQSVYKIGKKTEIPITLGLIGGMMGGFEYLKIKDGLELHEINQLNQNNISWLDRSVFKQDPTFRNRAHKISDAVLNSTVFFTGILAFDKDIRKDWLDLLILYGETHAINSSFYILNASLINRTRPFVYFHEIPLELKLDKETRNSFFSGHVSSAASASFFAAKVYSDYHPEIGNRKFWLFGAALIPPSVVGYYRIKALKHFPSDIYTGLIVGAAAGILIPEFHRIKERNSGLALIPFAGNFNGLKLCYTFR